MLHMIMLLLALWVPNPPEIKEYPNKMIQVTFPPGATDVCVFIRRETKQEPDLNFPDGYYTPSSCSPVWYEDQTTYETDMWDEILPWFITHKEPKSDWTVWAEIKYPLATSDLADPKEEIRKTETYRVNR